MMVGDVFLTLLTKSLLCTAGMKLQNLSKILKCAANDDVITMKSEDNGDTITFIFESPSKGLSAYILRFKTSL